MPSLSNFNCLPDDVFFHISLFLDVYSLGSLQLCNKNFKNIITNQALLIIFKNIFGQFPTDKNTNEKTM